MQLGFFMWQGKARFEFSAFICRTRQQLLSVPYVENSSFFLCRQYADPEYLCPHVFFQVVRGKRPAATTSKGGVTVSVSSSSLVARRGRQCRVCAVFPGRWLRKNEQVPQQQLYSRRKVPGGKKSMTCSVVLCCLLCVCACMCVCVCHSAGDPQGGVRRRERYVHR